MLFRAIVITIVFFVLLAIVLFSAAGTTDVPSFWAYIAVMVLLSAFTLGLVNMRSPDLIAERIRPGEGEQDKITLNAATLISIVTYVIAGLDAGRYHWSSVALWLQIVGFLLIAVGFTIITWAMLTNRFFSSAVRMQPDRGQELVSSGPYRIVRHPGYTGGILYLFGTGLALGSWFSVLPMALGVPLIIRRTLIEDRMLKENLAGYSDYAARVRYRLIPGIW